MNPKKGYESMKYNRTGASGLICGIQEPVGNPWQSCRDQIRTLRTAKQTRRPGKIQTRYTETRNEMDERNISQWIHRKMPELVETLKAICRVRSVAETENPSCMPYGEGCKKVLRDMLAIGREAGFATENFEDHAGRSSYPGKQKENIAIWSHLDVVDEGDDWDHDPYDPVCRGGAVLFQ